MLIGAHVSPAGGPANAVERGVERHCRAIQIFNQSPRQWRPTVYDDEKVAAYKEAFERSDVDALLIHAVYLLNCASEDKEIRKKSLDSLVASLRAGQALGAVGVVLHPGSALKSDVTGAIKRASKTIGEALKRSEGCVLHLENTAGAGGTLGRTFEELAALIEGAGGGKRLGACLDSCHLYASGFDVRTAAGLSETLDQCVELVGVDKIGCLHVNDSKTPLGSNVDRHAALGTAELGEEGIAAFLSEPRFEGLPMIFEGPGVGGKQVEPEDVEIMRRLRAQGLRQRSKK